MQNSTSGNEDLPSGSPGASCEASSGKERYNRNVSNWTVIVFLIIAFTLLYFPIRSLYVTWVEHEQEYYQKYRMRL